VRRGRRVACAPALDERTLEAVVVTSQRREQYVQSVPIYDWVARPGEFIYGTPRRTYTLVSDDPNAVELFGWLEGPTDFFDDE
jgi:hypothetical protein